MGTLHLPNLSYHRSSLYNGTWLQGDVDRSCHTPLIEYSTLTFVIGILNVYAGFLKLNELG